MSWTRGPLAALAAGALLVAGAAGRGSGGAHGRGDGKGTGGATSSPAAGRLLDGTDEQGRRLREADAGRAPGVDVEVRPDGGDRWDVRLTVHRFRFSPAGASPRAAAGRGYARLLVDGRPVAVLHGPDHHLPGRLVPHGTHRVTARLYADDGTAWAVGGKPVQSTVDLTASGPAASRTAASGPDVSESDAPGPARPATAAPVPAAATAPRPRPPAEGHGSPHRGGKAS
ncbi:nuclear transport factor 2 family protein [Streptomyces echinoruber]|uniref:nuclear transport factor 2 family protein n=1 Tax=Streptomyces echinoruber TaxID=68898 RepID=UPI0036200633